MVAAAYIAAAGFGVSAMTAPADARVTPVAPNATVSLSISLPLRNGAQLDRLIQNQSDQASPLYHHYLTPQQFRASFAPAQSDLVRVATAMRTRGFAIDHATSQGMVLRGSAAAVNRAFATQLLVNVPARRGATALIRPSGKIQLTPELAAVKATVSSFSPRFTHQTDFKRSAVPLAKPLNFLGPYGPYFTDDLKEAYGFPSSLAYTGYGEKIGNVISSYVDPGDIQAWFTDQGIPQKPRLVDRKVDGGQPLSPSDPNNFGVFEATLDVEQSLGIAPSATEVVYDTPDLTDQSILDAYQAAVDDDIVSVVNSSFGECELFYTAEYNGGEDFTSILIAEHDIFKQGNAEGITFLASSGDNGALGCADAATFTKFTIGVGSPANDPNVTAVGGTNLETTATAATSRRPNKSVYKAENAYGDPDVPYDEFGVTDQNGNPINQTGGIFGSGGGTSVLFGKPYYQHAVAANTFGRSIPDVAGHMGGCPDIAVQPCAVARSADLLTYQGFVYGVVGTSASSPDMAGLVALMNEVYKSRFGNVNPYLYELSYAQSKGALGTNPAFRTGIKGYNGLYSQNLPYDRVTGLGSVYGAAVGGLTVPLAGDPGDPSNP